MTRPSRAGALLLVLVFIGGAADFPARSRVGDQALVLNGSGLRTYGLFATEIYRAALYLPAPSHDAARIIADHAVREIRVRYLRGGGRAIVVRAWEKSFLDNCACALPEAFRSRVTDIREGDEERYAFYPDRVEISVNGAPPAVIAGASRAVLSTFIGEHPPTQELKRALLGAE